MLIAVALVIAAPLVFLHSLPERESWVSDDLDSWLSGNDGVVADSYLVPSAMVTT